MDNQYAIELVLVYDYAMSNARGTLASAPLFISIIFYYLFVTFVHIYNV